MGGAKKYPRPALPAKRGRARPRPTAKPGPFYRPRVLAGRLAYSSLRACKSAITSYIITPLSWVEPSTAPLGWLVQLVLNR